MAIWREKGSNRGRVASLVNSHMQVKKKWREKGSNRGRVASLVIVACREKKRKIKKNMAGAEVRIAGALFLSL
jgi:hypothetical protein